MVVQIYIKSVRHFEHLGVQLEHIENDFDLPDCFCILSFKGLCEIETI